MQGIVKKVGRYSNISWNGCAWKQQKWDHHYVHHGEKYSQENCLDWGKNTIFDVFPKIKLKCCLHFNGIDHISIIGTETPDSSRGKLLKWLKTEYPQLFWVLFLKAKLQNKPT